MDVKVADNAFEAVAVGTGMSLDDIENLRFMPKTAKRDKKRQTI